MNTPLFRVAVLLLTSLPLPILSGNPVSVQLEQSVVVVASGKSAIFTIKTIPDISLIRWTDSGGTTLAMWANGSPLVMPVPQYQGRISVTSSQLTITSSQVRDSGNYTVSVDPAATTGLGVNSAPLQLQVFDAVRGVSVGVPSLPLEGLNVSLSCGWTAGTNLSVLWSKAGTTLSSDAHISISGGSVLIQALRRDDAGEYSCTVSNAVSAQTAKSTLTVYYGPDAPQLNKTSYGCVGGGDATVGQAVVLSCSSASLPPASFSWSVNGQLVTAGQSGTGVLNLQIFSSGQAGRYVCAAQNDITGRTSSQQIDLAIVGTCLSGGAVAGIVVACVVMLIVIIVVIIVLLRQQHVERRLGDTTGLQKTNQDRSIAIPNGAVVNGNLADPSLMNLNTHNNNENINTMAQNILSIPPHHNAHLNTGDFHNNFNTAPFNGPQNNPSHRNNESRRTVPQHTPNFLIHTGNSQPVASAPIVHVNLNTLPHTDQFNTQPQTVHVNWTAYPPEQNQSNSRHQTGQSPIAHVTEIHPNLSETILPNTQPLRLPRNPAREGSHHPNNHNETHHSSQTSPNIRSSREEPAQPSSQNLVRNQFNSSTSPSQQMPWDHLHGTPMYPNGETGSSASSESLDLHPRIHRDLGSTQHRLSPRRDNRPQQDISSAQEMSRSSQQRSRSQQQDSRYLQQEAQRRQNIAERSTQTASVPQGTPQRVSSQSQIDLEPWRPMVRQFQVQSQTNRHELPQPVTSQGLNTVSASMPRDPQGRTAIRPNDVWAQESTLPQTAPPGQSNSRGVSLPQPLEETGVRQNEERGTILRRAQTGLRTTLTQPTPHNATRPMEFAGQPIIPLTEEALRQHTTQTDNPFNRIHQQDTVQNPGLNHKLNKVGQRAPTPPPVLQPAEFKMLPRKRMQQPQHTHPVKVPHRHRSPNKQNLVWHTQMQPTMHGHPVHRQQVHGSKPRH